MSFYLIREINAAPSVPPDQPRPPATPALDTNRNHRAMDRTLIGQFRDVVADSDALARVSPVS